MAQQHEPFGGFFGNSFPVCYGELFGGRYLDALQDQGLDWFEVMDRWAIEGAKIIKDAIDAGDLGPLQGMSVQELHIAICGLEHQRRYIDVVLDEIHYRHTGFRGNKGKKAFDRMFVQPERLAELDRQSESN
jgi:hypothetical protein